MDQETKFNMKDWEKLFEAIAHPTLILDPDHKILAVNRAAERMTGKKESSMIGKKCYDVFHNRRRPPASGCPMEKLKKDGHIETVAMEMETLNGQYLVSCTPVLDDNGKLDKIIHIATDITERINTEQAFKESEEKYRLLYTTANEGFLIMDLKSKVMDANPKLLSMIGFERDELVGKNLKELGRLLQVKSKMILNKFDLFLKGDLTSSDWIITTKTGEKLNVVVYPSFIKRNSKKIGISIILSDITKRKIAEEKLRKASLQWRVTFDAISDAIALLDIKGNILRCNKALTALTGKTFQQLIGHRCVDVIHGETGRPADCPLLKTQKSLKRENMLMPIGTRWYEVTVDPELNESGEFIGFVHIISDITDRQLVELEKEAALEALRVSEDRLSKILVAANDGTWDWNLKTNQVYFDRRYYRMAGYDVNEFPHRLKEFQKRVHPDDLDEVMIQAKKHINGVSNRFGVEFRFRKKDGSWMWIKGRGIIVERDKIGIPLRMVGTHTDITNRKKAELALHESETRNNAILNALPDLMFVISEDGTYLDYHATNPEILYTGPDKFLGKKMADVLPEKLASSFYDLIQKTIATGSMATFDYNLKIEKQTRYFEARIVPHGKDKVLSIIREITEQKIAEQAQHESEAKYRSLIENSNSGIYLLYDNKFEIINKKFEEMFGYTLADVNQPDFAFIKLVAPESIPMIEDRQRRISDGEEVESKYEFIGISKSGQKIDIEIATTDFEYKYGIATQGIIRDITDNKKSEKALKDSEERYRLLVENAYDGIEITQNDRLLFYNPQFAEMLGYDLKELEDVRFSNVFSEEALIRLKERKQKREAGEALEPYYETTFLKKDGSVIDVGVKYKIIDYKGKPATFSIIRDITTRKRNEERMQRDLHEKTILLKEIHHRVKNSLQVVSSLLHLQSRKVSDAHVIDLFHQSRSRILTMASVYEKLYRSESLSKIDFQEYLHDVLDSVYRSSNICTRVRLEMDIQKIVFGLDDAIPLALIANELFTNSMKYAFPDNKTGKIEIRLRVLKDQSYEFLYRDNGIGLPDHVEFETTTTLGLNLVRNLAEQINGETIFRQTQWSTFKILFKGNQLSKKKEQ